MKKPKKPTKKSLLAPKRPQAPLYQEQLVDLWLSADSPEYKLMAAFKIGLDEGRRRERLGIAD